MSARGAMPKMKCIHTNTWTCVSALAFLAFSSGAHAQALFDSHEILPVTVEGPLTTFQKERSDVDYLVAIEKRLGMRAR